MGGALGDISWLDENSTPIITFQTVNDQFAPYQSDILVVPTTCDDIVEVQGGLPTVTKANELGLNDAFRDIDDEYTAAAKAASGAAGHEYQEGLYPINIPLNALGRADGSPWNWWDKTKWDTIVHPLAGMTTCTGMIPAGASFHLVASLSNLNMSADKGRTYIDTIMGYYAPRAYAALNLALDSTTAVTLLDRNVVSLSISPNPSHGLLTLQSNPDFEMKSVRILDVSGKMVLNRPGVNASQVQIEHNQLAAGTYLVEIRFDKGIVTEKVLLH